MVNFMVEEDSASQDRGYNVDVDVDHRVTSVDVDDKSTCVDVNHKSLLWMWTEIHIFHSSSGCQIS